MRNTRNWERKSYKQTIAIHKRMKYNCSITVCVRALFETFLKRSYAAAYGHIFRKDGFKTAGEYLHEMKKERNGRYDGLFVEQLHAPDGKIHEFFMDKTGGDR